MGIYDFRSFWSLGISWRIGMQTYLLKADAEFFARIDAVAGRGKRAEWIRGACEARLSGGDRAPALVPGGVIPDAALGGFDRVAVPVRKVSSSEATAAILDGTMKPRPVVRKRGKRDWSGDYERVLGVVRERLRSSRELASDLGWAETRVEAVVSAMELEGLVRFERGGVVAV